MKSAKTKAKAFCKEQGLEGEGILVDIVILLKEHERDTRHAAIDSLLELERHEIDLFCHLTSQLDTEDVVLLDSATQTVLNTEVKDETLIMKRTRIVKRSV